MYSLSQVEAPTRQCAGSLNLVDAHHDFPLQPVHLSASSAHNNSSKLHQQCIKRMRVMPPHCRVQGLEQACTSTAVQGTTSQLLTVKSNVSLEPGDVCGMVQQERSMIVMLPLQ